MCVYRGVYWRRQWHPTPVLLPGKFHGWRSLVGCSPWVREESDTTERLHFHFALSSIGEGNGNPLQCSCLENPRDRGAWWVAVYGVAQSQIRLKRLSSNSSWAQQGACGREASIRSQGPHLTAVRLHFSLSVLNRSSVVGSCRCRFTSAPPQGGGLDDALRTRFEVGSGPAHFRWCPVAHPF